MAETLAAFGGRLSGVKPSVVVSPSLQNTDSALQVNVICCSRGARTSSVFDNRRVVYRNGTLDDQPKKRGSIGKLFKKLCCCCGSNEAKAEENREAINMFETYLVEQYGQTAFEAALVGAEIDLAGKKQSGKTLRVKELHILLSAAAQEAQKKNT